MPLFQVYGLLMETNWGVIPEDRLDELTNAMNDGAFDRDDFDDILEQYGETGINSDLDIEIYIDGKRQDFSNENYIGQISEPIEIDDDVNNDEYFLIEETVSKGLIYSCEIESDYDPEKLSFWFYCYMLGNTGVGINVLEIEYDGLDCLDRTLELSSYDVTLISPDGSVYEPTELEQNDADAINGNEDLFEKIYIFKEVAAYTNFCEYIAENVQDNIDSGINKTRIIYSGPDADPLSITYINTESELQYTPDPDTGWVEDEIGEIDVIWRPLNTLND